MQLNCYGLTRKITEITDFMDRKDIKIAAIQETKLTSRNKLMHSSNYTLIRLDRARNAGGGIAFILHNSVKYNPLATVINQAVLLAEERDEIRKQDLSDARVKELT